MASLPSRSQSPGGTAGTVSPSRISLRTSQGSTYDSPILSEPKPLAAVFPGTTMPPSCLSPTSPSDTTQARAGVAIIGGARLGSTLSLVEGRGLTGSPLRSGMTAVPQHYGSTLPRQSQPLAYGADPYGLYQRSALPRPDSLIGQSVHFSHWLVNRPGYQNPVSDYTLIVVRVPNLPVVVMLMSLLSLSYLMNSSAFGKPEKSYSTGEGRSYKTKKL